jgi:type III secretion system (T3SS) SseB-like protein
MSGERRLAFSEFQHDDGSADPRLVEAIASGDHGRVLSALTEARLLVPVVAMLGEVEYDENGLARDKSADMAVVLITGRDGRRALLAFTGTQALTAWQPDARPMPATAHLAATASVQEGAAALVIDIAGPSTVVIETEDLHHLAAAHTVIRLEDGTHVWATHA